MSADVEGSCAGFFADGPSEGLEDDVAAGMVASALAAATSGCWLFFLRAMLVPK
jgi:hypothetical protein